MKYFILLLIIFSFRQFPGNCQKTDYEIYHHYINTAEELFFVENNPDSSLYYYKKAFSEFDFVFAKDPLNASQIAYFSHKPFEEFLIKGFENGLKLSHLTSIKLFDPINNELLNDISLQQKYSVGRSKYLKRLDLNYLSFVYDRALKDQTDKNKENYNEIKLKNLEEWLTKIQLMGFPADKIIGLDDKNIFLETGNPEKDIDQIKKKYGHSLDYFTAEDDIISSKFIIIMLVHNQCAYSELHILFKELIQKGEIHPREVGLLYDNQFRTSINPANYRCKVPKPTEGVFNLNMFCNYNELDCSKEQSDHLRRKWFIVPLLVDDAKKKYEQKYGFRLFYGFWNCM